MRLLSVCILCFALTSIAVADEQLGLKFWLPPASDAAAGDTAEAEAHWEAVKAAATAGDVSRAYEEAFVALRADPMFAPARKLLGYVPFRGGYYTPFAIKQLSAGKVWHAKFGWLPENYVTRYENGERFYRGRWMSIENEAKMRTSVEQGWRVESDHYVLLTNHSLEGGVEMVNQLERLYAVWSQLFAGYRVDQLELLRRLQGKAPREPAIKQHKVVYFKTRDEYNEALKKQQPRINLTIGLYLDSDRTAYFFGGDEQDDGTLWHEATHQLFSETQPTVKNVGRNDNFWVVEGVACYMESFEEHVDEGYVLLGAPNAGRLPAARQRLLVDKFYVSLAKLTTMGMETLQADQRIRRIYSQSAGLCTYFLQADEGRWLKPFVGYLKAVYEGRADSDTLSRLMGESNPNLDTEYQHWMEHYGGADAATAVSDAEPAPSETAPAAAE